MSQGDRYLLQRLEAFVTAVASDVPSSETPPNDVASSDAIDTAMDDSRRCWRLPTRSERLPPRAVRTACEEVSMCPASRDTEPLPVAVLSVVKHDYVARGLISHPRFRPVVVADDADQPEWAHARNAAFAAEMNVPTCATSRRL